MTASLPAAPAGVPDPAALRTVADLYEQRLALDPRGIACVHFDPRGQRWQELGWDELARLARRYGAGLRRAGLVAGDRVAIQLANGPDWLALDWACARLGLVTVGLFADDSSSGTLRQLRDSGARILFTRDAATAGLLPRHEVPELREIVVPLPTLPGRERRLRALSPWLGADEVLPPAAVDPDQLASLVYTSGSTGSPKGVMLSHRNLVANVCAVQAAVRLQPDDQVLCTSALAHLYGRSVGVYLPLAAGATPVFSRGSGLLAEDLRSRRPTVLVGVPRVYERLHGALRQELDEGPAPRRALFRLAVESGWSARRRGPDAMKLRLLPTRLARRAGGLLQDRLGGRLRLAISGGAGLSPEIARVFIALGVPLLRGYGLTEAGPVVSVNRAEDCDPASEGQPLPGVETRTDANGELEVRGPGVMMGYWNDAAATAAVLDAAGWLRTGDKISRLDTQRIHLVGRIKEILVTATGEKASASAIEVLLRHSPLVEQVMVLGEARPYLSALIVPQPGPLALLRARIGIVDGDDSPAARELVEQVVLEECQALLREAPRNHWLLRVALVYQPWTVANGRMTATQKLRRGEIERAHEADIARLYAGHYPADLTDCSRNATL